MKLKLWQLRTLIESILLEYTPQPGVRLYHRSFAKFKPGDVLTPQMDQKTGQHWLASRETEKKLEEFRKNNYPDLPSRLQCVYASLVPRSRFLNKGHLYVIEPIGDMLVTDSRIIDTLESRYKSQYNFSTRDFYQPYVPKNEPFFKDYWEGVEPNGREGNVRDLEVLMTSARVVEAVNESRVWSGDVITLGDGVTFDAKILFFNDDNEFYTYEADSNTKLGSEAALEMLKRTPNIKILNELPKDFDERSFELNVKLLPGFTGWIRRLHVADPRSTGIFNAPTIALSTTTDKRGISMQIKDFKDGARFARLVRSGDIKVKS